MTTLPVHLQHRHVSLEPEVQHTSPLKVLSVTGRKLQAPVPKPFSFPQDNNANTHSSHSASGCVQEAGVPAFLEAYRDAGFDSGATSIVRRGFRLFAEGAKQLADLGIGECADLEELNLQSCCIGDEGISALAPELRGLPALSHLTLSWNELEGAGTIALCLALPFLPALTLLDLSYNDVAADRESVTKLTHTLPRCPRLRRLVLVHCGFGPRDVRLTRATPSLTGSITAATR